MGISKYFSFAKDLLQILPSGRSDIYTGPKNGEGQKPIVVLVTGFGANDRALSIMRKRLLRDGFDVSILPLEWNELSDSAHGLYRMADRLSYLVRDIREKRGSAVPPLHLVAHSAGGLVARYYVQFLGGEKYCNGLITLATPHKGTWIAALGFLTHLVMKSRSLYHMLPISPFIKRLNSVPLPPGFPVVNIYSKDDPICKGQAEIETNSDVKTIELSGFTHGDFLYRKQTYAVVLENLRSAEVQEAAG